MSVARRPVDDDAVLLQPGAEIVDIVDLVCQMAEIAAAGIILGVPVIGELQARRLVFLRRSNVVARRKKHESEAAFFVLDSAYFRKTEQVDIEFK
ncbi:hypothetical protein D3C78_1296730 [compost metagenome]